MHKVKIELEFDEMPTRQDVIDVIKSDKFWFELISPPNPKGLEEFMEHKTQQSGK